jgi:hypothetical protein
LVVQWNEEKDLLTVALKTLEKLNPPLPISILFNLVMRLKFDLNHFCKKSLLLFKFNKNNIYLPLLKRE